jgi:hypothetical protein
VQTLCPFQLLTDSKWKGTATRGTPWKAASYTECSPEWLTNARVLVWPSASYVGVAQHTPQQQQQQQQQQEQQQQ